MKNLNNYFLLGAFVLAASSVLAETEIGFTADPAQFLIAAQAGASFISAPTPIADVSLVTDKGALNMAVPVEELITFINDVPPEKRAPIIAQTARLMGPMLNGEPRNLNGVSAIVKLLQRLDPQSGHAYYFCGEVARKLKPKELPTDYECFFSYLAYEKTLSPEAKSGKAARCYEREQGYCEERTGWICHLLANDLYKIPKEMSSFSDMKDRLQKAAIYAQCALDNYPPKGFTQLTPTVELQGKINAALKAL